MPINPWLIAVVSSALSLILFALYRWIAGRYMRQAFRAAGPEHHHKKGAIPTGAGVVLILLLLIAGAAAFYFADSDAPGGQLGVYLCWAAALMGMLGWIDDRRKVLYGSTGLKARYKLPVMIGVGLVLLYLLSGYFGELQQVFALRSAQLPWPIFAPWWIYYPVGLFVWLGAINGANFTDGLDGMLDGTTLVILAGSFYALLDGTDPLALPASVGVGVLVAYLFFNRRPAVLYVGDSGSLAIGALIAGLFLAKGWWLFLGLAASIWVLEVISVMLQVVVFKATGKRLLLMSPLHHHFELAGLSEPVIVWLFIALQALGCLSAIAWLRYGILWGVSGLVLLVVSIVILLWRFHRPVAQPITLR